MHTRTFRCQSRIETFRLWGAEIGLFPKKFTYSFMRTASLSHEWKKRQNEREKRGWKRKRSRTRSLFAFLPLLTSYLRAYFLHQPSRIVKLNLFSLIFFFFQSSIPRRKHRVKFEIEEMRGRNENE